MKVGGTVNVLTPPTNSLCTEVNSYRVQFRGPQRFFDFERWTTKRISGTLQRVRFDSGWGEDLFFSTDGGGGRTTGVANVTVSINPPINATPGDLWWDSVGGNLFILYDDNSSIQWVVTNALTGVVTPPAGSSAMNFPTSPARGDAFVSPAGAVYSWDGVKWMLGVLTT